MSDVVMAALVGGLVGSAVGAVLGGAFSLGGVALAGWIERSRDRERVAREDRLREQERWRDRRREVCVATVGRAMALQQMAVNHRAGRRVKIDEYFPVVQDAFASTAELALISESLADTGGDLMIAANTLLQTAVTTKTAIDGEAQAFNAALRAFMEAARADLRI
jgi:hypothetical protein